MIRTLTMLACIFAASTSHAQTDFRNALNLAFPATVKIQSDRLAQNNGFFNGRININQLQFGEVVPLPGTLGRTGFAVGADLVATQLPSGIDEVKVTTREQSEMEATVVARDAVTGIAILKVKDAQFVSLVVGAGTPEAGLPVVASQFQGADVTAKSGMIAGNLTSSNHSLGYTQPISGDLATAAPGAPVLDANGVVIGMVGQSDNGKVCCVSTVQLQRLVDAAAAGEELELKRGMVGIQFQGDQLADVMKVAPGTPAETAGIQIGDKVISVGEYEVTTTRDVLAAVSMFRSDQEVPVVVDRDGELIEHKIVLKERPGQKLAANQVGPQGARAQFQQRAFRLDNGRLVPIENGELNIEGELDDIQAMIPKDIFRGFGNGRFIMPGMPGQIRGFEVERSELEDSLQKLESEKQEQADEIRSLKQRLEKLQSKLEEL